MKIDANKLFVATAITFAVSWIICAIFVGLLPVGMMTMTGHMVHMNLGSLSWSMTFTGFITGLIAWSLLPGAIAWCIATIYNRLALAG